MYFWKVMVFWDVTPCNLADNYELLRGTSSAQKVEALCSLKTLVFVYQSSWSPSQKTVISIVTFMRTSFLCHICIIRYWFAVTWACLFFGVCTFPMLILWPVSYVQPVCFLHCPFNIRFSFRIHPVSSYFLEICALLGFYTV